MQSPISIALHFRRGLCFSALSERKFFLRKGADENARRKSKSENAAGHAWRKKLDLSGSRASMDVGSSPAHLENEISAQTSVQATQEFDTDNGCHVKLFFRTEHMALMENYLTVSQGILSATKSVSLKKANVTVQVNGHGLMERIGGDVTLLLDTGRDGTRELGITFYLNVSDIDGSHVEKFDPSAYGVKLASGYQPAEKTVKTMDSDTEKRFLEMSKTRWWLAGYTIDDTMRG